MSVHFLKIEFLGQLFNGCNLIDYSEIGYITGLSPNKTAGGLEDFMEACARNILA